MQTSHQCTVLLHPDALIQNHSLHLAPPPPSPTPHPQDQLLQAQVSAGPTAGPALSLALTPDTVITGWGDGTLRAHVRAPPPTPLIDPVTGVYTNGHAGSPYHTHHSPHKTQVCVCAGVRSVGTGLLRAGTMSV
jgi:hypothetical protein